MPELPDVTLYVESLEQRYAGHHLSQIRIASPFVLRSVTPPVSEAIGRKLLGARRLGKRIAIELEGDLFLVFHLMIAGRFHEKTFVDGAPPKIPAKVGLLSMDFEGLGRSLVLTEASQKRRASLFVVLGREELESHRRSGIEPLSSSDDELRAALSHQRHTLKRALTDPDILSGIGNAYSDEILHAAKLSPFAQTTSLSDDEWARLTKAIRAVLKLWTDRLRAELQGAFPEKVTAFREGMAVHGRYRHPCPVCQSPVLRIVHGDNESCYCPGCQTNGRVLADRSLSRLLKEDWPRSINELEAARPGFKKLEAKNSQATRGAKRR